MEDEVDLPLIRYEFKHGSTEEQAFLNICRDHEIEPPSESLIKSWFERFRNGYLRKELEAFHYNLLRSIIVQYSKFRYAIFCHDYDVWNYGSDTIIRSRFNLVGNGTKKSFTVFDSFNEGVKVVQTEINLLASWYFPVLINHERILLTVYRENHDRLVLLNVNFDQLTCSVVEKVSLNFGCEQIILDSTDNSRFLLRFEYGDAFFQKGHIFDDKIHLEHERIPVEAELFCCKMEGDRFFGFQREEHDEDDWLFVEYDLSLNSAREVTRWPLSESPKCFGIYGNHYEYVWSCKKLYAVYDFNGYFSISAFDSDTLTWSKVIFIGAGYADKLSIDEDDMLTITATENSDGRDNLKPKTVYRIPMRKPDKLRYIAWFKIRRQALFFGNKLDFLLPYTSEFREFSDNY